MHISLADGNTRAISDTFTHHTGGRKSKTIERTTNMKTPTSIVAVMSAVLLSGASAYAQGDASSPACDDSSWNPESYCFYGEKAKIVEKFGNISTTKLSERRVFLQVTQGESKADVRLYERQKDSKFTVTQWKAKQTSRLLADIDKAIIANKGVDCVGEQVKGILGRELKGGKVSKEIPAPETTKAAFAHPVNEAKGEFIKSVIFLLC